MHSVSRAGQVWVAVLMTLPGVVFAEPPPKDTWTGGRLAVASTGESALIGDLWADLPFSTGPEQEFYLALYARTVVDGTGQDLSFEVSDLIYDLQLGWRMDGVAGARGPRLAAYIGERGRRAVDEPGAAWVRYAAVGLESRRFRRLKPSAQDGPRRVEGWVALGPVMEDRGIDADAVMRGGARFILLGYRKARRGELGFDVEIDGLWQDRSFKADVAVGPRWSFPVSGGRRASIYVHYLRSRNPLGLGHSTTLFGIEYAEGTAVDRGPRWTPPQIEGTLGVGGGTDRRLAGELRLRLLSPAFARVWRAAFRIRAEYLTAEETTDLYYRYQLGIERAMGSWTLGGWFYHRSNHQLSHPSPDLTLLNVLEVGVDSLYWPLTGRRPRAGRWGRLDGSFRVGYVERSSFGEDPRWHLRGGARWALPVARDLLAPYLHAEFERGDVERTQIGCGVSPGARWEVGLEYRRDDQYFAREQHVGLVVVRYGF